MPEKIARNRKGKGGGWERVARSRGWLSRWGATTERDSRHLPSTLTSVTYKDRPTLSPPPSSSFSLLPPSTHPPTPPPFTLSLPEREKASMQDIIYRPYNGESDLQHIIALVQNELSEPYVIYTYRYFLHQW